MPKVILILISASIVCSITVNAEQGEYFSISGYFKNYSTVLDILDVDDRYPYAPYLPFDLDPPLMGSVSNRLRLKVVGRAGDRLSITGAYDFSPVIQDKLLFEESVFDPALSWPVYRVADFDPILYPRDKDKISSFALYHNLDRLSITLNSGPADIFVGRQAIAWGSARMINPTDILAPYTFDRLDVEDRQGVDAVRVRIPVGFMGEIDAGYVAGEDFKPGEDAWFLRAKYYALRSDISVMGIRFHKNTLIGVDIARALGGAGIWLEAAYVFAEDSYRVYYGWQENDYARVSVGGDYSLRDGTYIFFEYHFNQAGAIHPEEFSYESNPVAYGPGTVYLIGKHYLAPGVVYQVTPLISLTLPALINLPDPSAYVMPSAEYNIAENIYLSGGVHLGIGKSPVLKRLDISNPLILKSEFGAYPDICYFSTRIYF